MLILILEHAGSGEQINEYLKSYDPEAHFGQGSATFTKNKLEALKFQSAAEALALWNAQSETQPMRPDGRPNKPLTAFTISIEGE